MTRSSQLPPNQTTRAIEYMLLVNTLCFGKQTRLNMTAGVASRVASVGNARAT